MPNSVWKYAIALVAGVAFVGLLAYLPQVRKSQWEHTLASSKLSDVPKSPEELEEEKAIEQAATVDESQFAKDLGIRYVRRIPTSKIALEAAFRQRRSEAAVMLPASKPLFMTRFVMDPTSNAALRDGGRLLECRSAVVSIGLNMRDSDETKLPWMSRSTILDFIQGHFVSLQARLLKDDVSGEVFLHHRPMAAVAKYRSLPLTENFVSPITETVADIRGLGIYRETSDSESSSSSRNQTAIWLFRSLWLKESAPTIHYDYAFVRIIGEDRELPKLSVVLTTHNLSRWHCLVDSEDTREPLRGEATSMLGTIHFLEYASDGLHPKSSATRDVRIKSVKEYQLIDIIDYLSSNGHEGDWGEHLSEALDFVTSR